MADTEKENSPEAETIAAEIGRLLDSSARLRESDPKEAEARARQAITLAQERGMLTLEAKAHEVLARTFFRPGRFDDMARAAELSKALVIHKKLRDEINQARILAVLGNIASNAADYTSALDYLYEAEDICARVEDVSLSSTVLGHLSGVHMELGDYEAALSYANRVLEISSGSNDPYVKVLALNPVGCILALMGEHEQGIAKIREAHTYIEEIAEPSTRAHLLAQSFADLAEAFLNGGKPAEALVNAEQGTRIANESANLPLLMLNMRYAGRAALALGNPKQAAQSLGTSLELATRMGQRSQESKIRFELGEALAGLGDYREALESHGEARRIEKEMRHDQVGRRVEFRRVKQEIDNARREAGLARSEARAMEIASRHKSEFLASMSHELRTPLNAILGFSEMLDERYFGDLTARQAEYVKDIREAGNHLLSLINDILDLSKVEAGRMELDVAELDPSAVIDNAVLLIRERAARHGIALAKDVDPSVGVICTDERKFKQILLNLLSNAVKFTPDGGAITVRARSTNSMIEIAVADTGPGIAPEDQGAVFEEFKQVGPASARKAEGTGLGLPLAKRFVELLGGEIWLESVRGKGSTFSLRLPIRPSETTLSPESGSRKT